MWKRSEILNQRILREKMWQFTTNRAKFQGKLPYHVKIFRWWKVFVFFSASLSVPSSWVFSNSGSLLDISPSVAPKLSVSLCLMLEGILCTWTLMQVRKSGWWWGVASVVSDLCTVSDYLKKLVNSVIRNSPVPTVFLLKSEGWRWHRLLLQSGGIYLRLEWDCPFQFEIRRSKTYRVHLGTRSIDYAYGIWQLPGS